MNSTFTQPAINRLLSDYPSLVSVFIMLCFMAEMMVFCACHYGIFYMMDRIRISRVNYVNIKGDTKENEYTEYIEYIEYIELSTINIYKDNDEEIKRDNE